MKRLETQERSSVFAAQPVGLHFIASLLGLHILFTLVVNLILFENGTLSIISKTTNGWINETLTANLFGILIEVIIFLFFIAKVSPRDIGIKTATLWPGLLGTFLFWLAINLVDFCMTLLNHSTLTSNKDIFRYPGYFLGEMLGQILGNALLEETLFRGFLLVQIYLCLKKIHSHNSRMVYAMLISQSIFAAIHIPNRIYSGLAGMEFVYDFITLVILGVIFSLIYMLTKNLFFVIGVHALMNVQLTFWYSNYTYTATLICVFGLVFLLLWSLYHKKRSSNHN